MKQILAVRCSDVIPRRSIKFCPAQEHVRFLYEELINGKYKTWITGTYFWITRPRQNMMSCWLTNVLNKHEVSSSTKIVWRRKKSGGGWSKAKNGSAYITVFYDQKHNYQVKILLEFFFFKIPIQDSSPSINNKILPCHIKSLLKVQSFWAPCTLKWE
jgi:hypothetical protein